MLLKKSIATIVVAVPLFYGGCVETVPESDTATLDSQIDQIGKSVGAHSMTVNDDLDVRVYNLERYHKGNEDTIEIRATHDGEKWNIDSVETSSGGLDAVELEIQKINENGRW